MGDINGKKMNHENSFSSNSVKNKRKIGDILNQKFNSWNKDGRFKYREVSFRFELTRDL
jgi:hypothetical protein